MDGDELPLCLWWIGVTGSAGTRLGDNSISIVGWAVEDFGWILIDEFGNVVEELEIVSDDGFDATDRRAIFAIAMETYPVENENGKICYTDDNGRFNY